MDINLTNPVTTAKIGEVVNGASAATPNDTDILPVIDTSVAKKITLTNFKAFLKTYFDTLYLGDSVTVNSIGSAINGAASATPNDTDLVMSVDTSVAKKNTWTQVKAFLKTYFDTIYQAAGTYLTSANITQVITNGVTDKAPSEDAVFDALALKSPYPVGKWYSDSTAVNPGDGGVFYFGVLNNSAVIPANTYKFKSPKTSCIFHVAVNAWVLTTLGSNEDTVIKIQNVTQATEETLTPLKTDARHNSSYSVSTLANTLGDDITIQCTSPTWSTNPTNVQYQFIIEGF